MSSYFIYNISVLISIFCAYLHDYRSENYSYGIKRLLIFLSFLTLFLLSALRFDVGPDYENYVNIYYNIANGMVGITFNQIAFGYLSLLFSHIDRGYMWVFSIYSFLTLYFVFRTLLERKILAWGLVIFCFVGFYLDSFDRIRQVLAVAIFLYSIKYIEEHRFLKYILCILGASFFHLSVILLLPAYFYNKVKINSITAFIVLLVLFSLHLTGITGLAQSYIYNHIPYYNKIYGGSSFANSQAEFGTGLGFLFNMLLIFFSIAFLKCHTYLRGILLTAGVLMLLSPGNLNIIRFGQYFYISLILVLPYIFVYGRHSFFNKLLVFTLLFVFFQAQLARNNYTYQSVFSDSFSLEIFSPRLSDRPLAKIE